MTISDVGRWSSTSARRQPAPVASLLDVIRSKETANRDKDRAQLPALRQTLEVIREREAREKS